MKLKSFVKSVCGSQSKDIIYEEVQDYIIKDRLYSAVCCLEAAKKTYGVNEFMQEMQDRKISYYADYDDPCPNSGLDCLLSLFLCNYCMDENDDDGCCCC